MKTTVILVGKSVVLPKKTVFLVEKSVIPMKKTVFLARRSVVFVKKSVDLPKRNVFSPGMTVFSVQKSVVFGQLFTRFGFSAGSVTNHLHNHR